MTGINWQSQSFTVTVPFQAYIHGRMLNTLVVNSTGVLLFQYQSSKALSYHRRQLVRDEAGLRLRQ